MEIIVCKNYEEMSERAFAVIKEVVKTKSNPVLGLATGSSPIGLYQAWVKDHKENKTSYENVVTFNLDEYVGLPQGHKETYRVFMENQLFSHIDVKEENIHVPAGHSADPAKEALAYEELLGQHTIDLQLLGVGRNGHIGFNEPGTPFDQTTNVIDLQQSTIEDNAKFFDGDLSLVPTKAVTMGIASIMRAKKILLIASGENKADAIYQLVHGEQSEDAPVSVLQSHPDVVVIVDEAAAKRM